MNTNIGQHYESTYYLSKGNNDSQMLRPYSLCFTWSSLPQLP